MQECNGPRSISGSNGGASYAINQGRLRSSRTRVIFKIACTILCVQVEYDNCVGERGAVSRHRRWDYRAQAARPPAEASPAAAWLGPPRGLDSPRPTRRTSPRLVTYYSTPYQPNAMTSPTFLLILINSYYVHYQKPIVFGPLNSLQNFAEAILFPLFLL